MVADLHPQLELDLLQVNINDISHILAQGKASSRGVSIPDLSGKFDKLNILET